MPDEDIAEQAAIAATFGAAIATIEQHLGITEGALGVTGDPDFGASDSDAIQQLLASLGEANTHLANGELALGDIGFDAEEGEAHA